MFWNKKEPERMTYESWKQKNSPKRNPFKQHYGETDDHYERRMAWMRDNCDINGNVIHKETEQHIPRQDQLGFGGQQVLDTLMIFKKEQFVKDMNSYLADPEMRDRIELAFMIAESSSPSTTVAATPAQDGEK